MNKYILSLAAICLSAVAQASTVNWGAQTDTVLLSNGGNNTTLLTAGSIIRLGNFNLSNSQIASLNLAGNYSALDAAFTPFDFATSGQNTSPFTPGVFTKASFSPTNVNANLQIYVWVLQSSNSSSVANALSTAFAQSIFYVDKAVNPQWTFPTSFNAVADIDIGDMTNAVGGAAPGANLVVGNYVANVNRPDIATLFQASRIEGIQTAVPEPTSAFLIAIGAAGLITRRRRQS